MVTNSANERKACSPGFAMCRLFQAVPIFKFFKSLIFNMRAKRAIRQARASAELHRKKYLVLVNNGRPVCVSMQALKHLIAQKRFAPGFTADKARQIAIFEAMPPKNSCRCS